MELQRNTTIADFDETDFTSFSYPETLTNFTPRQATSLIETIKDYRNGVRLSSYCLLESRKTAGEVHDFIKAAFLEAVTNSSALKNETEGAIVVNEKDKDILLKAFDITIDAFEDVDRSRGPKHLQHMVVHAIEVAMLTATATKDPNTIMAALLHDIYENYKTFDGTKIDADFHRSRIISELGNETSELIDYVTEPRGKFNQTWEERKTGIISKIEDIDDNSIREKAATIIISSKISTFGDLVMHLRRDGVVGKGESEDKIGWSEGSADQNIQILKSYINFGKEQNVNKILVNTLAAQLEEVELLLENIEKS